ncbi:mitogen-activated protein kinase kinase kinase 17 [Senna tora]|uniref:Mitogen-activated protein kinase kinase kinase 17 n=1 Tax=Senna tora TaxID=362788 RepID=A0A834XGG4_9FABA|nr:mitogen-activated protein kinase kinase kinase 17 [Senna tora]
MGNPKILGVGSTGTVFKGVPVAIQRGNTGVRAIKNSLFISALVREEFILKSFKGCPHILQCYDGQYSEENEKITYNLIMEYAPHGTLRTLININNPLPEILVRTYTRMILKGLSYIHHENIVHCDLKPENILLFPPSYSSQSPSGENFNLKIADFGLAMTEEEKIVNDEGCCFPKFRFRGTPYYMSPESVRGVIDTALDVWSLGCLVIEMIIGMPAWWKLEGIEELMFTLAMERKPPEIPDGVSEECGDFLRKCLVVDPKGRWTTDMLLNHPFIISSNQENRSFEEMFSKLL